jgi:putative urate catabolism protein
VLIRPDNDRDLRGYGRDVPDPRWPGGARVAVQLVLNYEEGGELTPLNGDAMSEPFMNEVPLGDPILGRRNPTSESLYSYGSRAGFWRLFRLFEERQLPMTVFMVGRALELNPEAGAALAEAGHEIAGHGYRWIDYRNVAEEVERAHIRATVEIIEQCTGRPPAGWFTGRISANTRRLVVEHGGFLYDSDAYDDDLPYWVDVNGKTHLVVPYTFDANDMKYTTTPGFTSNEDFLAYLKDGFDMLYQEGGDSPKMMSIGLHNRVVGRPSRALAVARFLDYVCARPDVWICTRREIAEHWYREHPAPAT